MVGSMSLGSEGDQVWMPESRRTSLRDGHGQLETVVGISDSDGNENTFKIRTSIDNSLNDGREASLAIVEIPIAGTSQQTTVAVLSVQLSDPSHPNNWSPRKKALVITAGILSDLSSTLGSTLPSNAIPYIADTFSVTSQTQRILPISLYIFGFVLGPILYGPLSENFGRKPVLVMPFIGYTVFTLACALAQTWPSFLVFRWLCGVFASSPIAIVGGIFADIYSDPKKRGIYLTWFIAVSGFGPCLGKKLPRNLPYYFTCSLILTQVHYGCVTRMHLDLNEQIRTNGSS